MKLSEIKKEIPKEVYEVLKKEGIKDLRPSQEKAIKSGLLKEKSLLICTPTASGKTLTAELTLTKNIIEGKGKAVYIVPLKALATEKYKEFKRKYPFLRIALSIGDLDKKEERLNDSDLIICTSEKLDSLIRHHAPWIKYLSVVIIDEIHLINDPSRGPTLEILITMLKEKIKNIQIIGLSATIGNPQQLADWLGGKLVLDKWRPVQLKEGIYLDGTIEFMKTN